MTLTERANRLVGDMPWVTGNLTPAQIADLARQIAASMRAVINEERVACAKFIRSRGQENEWSELVDTTMRGLGKTHLDAACRCGSKLDLRAEIKSIPEDGMLVGVCDKCYADYCIKAGKDWLKAFKPVVVCGVIP